MHEVVAKMWTAALRSGDYKQGFNRLNHCGNFCVLGVLCDVLNPGGWFGDPFVGGKAMFHQATKLPEPIRQMAGIMKEYPTINGQDIVGMNDRQRVTFAEFADLIDQHWEQI